ncbi:MAG: uracil-DNA glycosylase [Beijerinckiaceae bacterium]|nr:uracil-DNA glycosylase [Beijerinckiaceae bacterium]
MPAFHQCEPVPGPDPDCPLCPRLAKLRNSLRSAQPDWHNAPVPSFGSFDARLLIVGLAPGLRGANRTGRPFTGDFAGELLFETLVDFGFASGTYAAARGDGLRLRSCMITNAVRCVPPQNKPAPSEAANCRQFLTATISALIELRVILVLGRLAHDSVLRALGARPGAFQFAHGAEHEMPIQHTAAPDPAGSTNKIIIIDSYHCSRYNTSTGVLTREKFRAVFAKLRERLQG